jgi:hypothetical protein
MSEPKKYWMVDAEGAKALVVGAEARDFWTVHGWSETTEPVDQEFVWLKHEETKGRGKFNAQAVPLWAPRGWYPSDPPAPLNPAVAHREVIEPPVPAAPQTTASTKTAASATSGDKKE